MWVGETRRSNKEKDYTRITYKQIDNINNEDKHDSNTFKWFILPKSESIILLHGLMKNLYEKFLDVNLRIREILRARKAWESGSLVLEKTHTLPNGWSLATTHSQWKLAAEEHQQTNILARLSRKSESNSHILKQSNWNGKSKTIWKTYIQKYKQKLKYRYSIYILILTICQQVI